MVNNLSKKNPNNSRNNNSRNNSRNRKSKKLFVDLSKIQGRYDVEVARLKRMTNEQLNDEETRINDLPEVNNENEMTEILSNFSNKTKKLSYKELVEHTKEYLPKNSKSEKRCLEEYQEVEEVKDDFDYGDVSKYKAKKDGQEVFIKTKSLNYVTQKKVDTFKNEIELGKKISENNLGPELVDNYICKDSKGKPKLFLVYKKLNGVNLMEWKKTNNLTEEHKQKIVELVDKCFEVGVVPGWLSESKIFVKDDGSFVLTSTSGAINVQEILQEKKKSVMNSLEWITEDSNKFADLAIKRLIREKVIKFKV
jgi:hypothetical protein